MSKATDGRRHLPLSLNDLKNLAWLGMHSTLFTACNHPMNPLTFKLPLLGLEVSPLALYLLPKILALLQVESGRFLHNFAPDMLERILPNMRRIISESTNLETNTDANKMLDLHTIFLAKVLLNTLMPIITSALAMHNGISAQKVALPAIWAFIYDMRYIYIESIALSSGKTAEKIAKAYAENVKEWLLLIINGADQATQKAQEEEMKALFFNDFTKFKNTLQAVRETLQTEFSARVSPENLGLILSAAYESITWALKHAFNEGISKNLQRLTQARQPKEVETTFTIALS